MPRRSRKNPPKSHKGPKNRPRQSYGHQHDANPTHYNTNYEATRDIERAPGHQQSYQGYQKTHKNANRRFKQRTKNSPKYGGNKDRLFLAGLSFNFTEAQLYKFFKRSYKSLQRVILVDQKGDSGLNQGFGFADFSDPAEKAEVLRREFFVLDGRRFSAKPFKKGKQLQKFKNGVKNRRIFIHNVDWRVTNKQLMDFFGRLVQLEDAYLINRTEFDPSVSEKRKYGYLVLKREEDAQILFRRKSYLLGRSKILLKAYNSARHKNWKQREGEEGEESVEGFRGSPDGSGASGDRFGESYCEEELYRPLDEFEVAGAGERSQRSQKASAELLSELRGGRSQRFDQFHNKKTFLDDFEHEGEMSGDFDFEGQGETIGPMGDHSLLDRGSQKAQEGKRHQTLKGYTVPRYEDSGDLVKELRHQRTSKTQQSQKEEPRSPITPENGLKSSTYFSHQRHQKEAAKTGEGSNSMVQDSGSPKNICLPINNTKNITKKNSEKRLFSQKELDLYDLPQPADSHIPSLVFRNTIPSLLTNQFYGEVEVAGMTVNVFNDHQRLKMRKNYPKSRILRPQNSQNPRNQQKEDEGFSGLPDGKKDLFTQVFVTSFIEKNHWPCNLCLNTPQPEPSHCNQSVHKEKDRGSAGSEVEDGNHPSGFLGKEFRRF